MLHNSGKEESTGNSFSCIIIGEGTLPIRCAEILTAGGHDLRTVISNDADLRKWAKDNKIQVLTDVSQLNDSSAAPFDFLFSIVNDTILRADVLGLAQRGAINYHDAPLPRYAGTYSTSWALMNGETSHGISWHLITDEIDGGDILKQKTVAIGETDTALTLNAKCYEAAIAAFSELVGELENNTFAAVPQNPAQRTYYGRFKKPSNGGMLSWQQTVNELSRTVRGLDFGAYPNPLGSTKMLIGNEYLIVKQLEICGEKPAAPIPVGIITKLGKDFIRVAAADGEVELRQLQRLDGKAVVIPELIEEKGLCEGSRLPELSTREIEQLTKLQQATARRESYWLQKLDSLQPAAVPYAVKNLSADAAKYSALTMPLPAEFLSFFEKREKSGKLEKLLLTAFGTLLARLGNPESFDVGYSHPEINCRTNNFNKLFAPQIPLRFEIDDKNNLTEYFESAVEEINSVVKHQTYALDIFARYPQFEISSAPDNNFALPVAFAEAARFEDFQPADGNELILVVSETECRWIYDTEKLGKASVEKLADSFTNLLKSAAISPETPIAELSVLTEKEKYRLLVEWNETRAEYPEDKCLHQLFEEQAEKTPAATALVFGEKCLTYRELNRRANQLAHYLLASGVKKGEKIGIYAERSIEAVIAIWAILKAGGTYIPLDPSYPAERLKYKLNDTKLSFVLAQERFSEQLKDQCENVICIDAVCDQIAEQSGENPLVEQTNTAPAYIIYTSGSTGMPKGVMVSHKSLVNHSFAITNLYELRTADRILQFASFNFDVAAEELFPSLLCGATLVLLPQQTQSSLKSFTEFLDQEKLTVVNLPVSYWRQWTLSLTDSELKLPDTLRMVVTGSEKVLAEDYNAWRKIAGHQIRWLNAYGLTETTITSIVFDPSLNPEPKADWNIMPIGRPIGNTEVYLLDRNLQPVPVGIPGNLYIGGDGLALGYLNQPKISAEKFISHPFKSASDARLFKSGDLARYLPTGEIEYLGRSDNQVKIRGFRIEPAEIESFLTAHPELCESVVIAEESKSGETNLIAYIVPHEENQTPQTAPIELWASVGEYPVYDELMYYAMSTDEGRTSRYEVAIKELVKDKTVVEIGTGKDVILARFCIAAGAKKVYAIEALDSAYRGAKKLVDSLGLSDRIILIKGFSTEVELPEKVDVCVSEIIGTIGSSEGAVPVLNDARRFLKPHGAMIPERCVTKIAAVQIPDEILNSPHFSELSEKYAGKIFQEIGYKFDVRVCLGNLPQTNILSDHGIFEDLDFTSYINPDSTAEITLNITKSGRLDGFLLWLNLHTVKDLVIDNLEEKSSWLPVYFPVFESGIEVVEGDVIRAVCRSRISDNGFNPDYVIRGALHRKNGETIEFSHDSFHHEPVFKQTAFYQKLFSENKIPVRKLETQGVCPKKLKKFLSRFLPVYMIPSVFVELAEMPKLPNGKIDRKALPAPKIELSNAESDSSPVRDEIESKLVAIWKEILEIRSVGVQDNFFDLGGHSLKAIRMFAEVEETFGKSIPIATLFQAGTVEKLAAILRESEWSAPESSIVPIQPAGTKPPFFCIHAMGGNVLFYRDLAKHLGKDQPFYGVQARRLGGRQVGHATVEEMAEFYIKEIKTVQPEGPYFLGGSSFGGLAAFEMARQLRMAGEEVGLLALLDTGTPDYPKVLPTTTAFRSKLYEMIRRIQHHRDSLKAFDTAEKKAYIVEKLKKVRLKYRRKVNDLHKKAMRRFYQKTKGAEAIPQNYIQIEDQIGKAGVNYAPPVYEGKMTLFRATNQPLGIVEDATLGWARYIDGEIEIHEVPGHHGSIVAEPYVKTLAVKLTNCLELAGEKENNFAENPAAEKTNRSRSASASKFNSILPFSPALFVKENYANLIANTPVEDIFLFEIALTAFC